MLRFKYGPNLFLWLKYPYDVRWHVSKKSNGFWLICSYTGSKRGGFVLCIGKERLVYTRQFCWAAAPVQRHIGVRFSLYFPLCYSIKWQQKEVCGIGRKQTFLFQSLEKAVRLLDHLYSMARMEHRKIYLKSNNANIWRHHINIFLLFSLTAIMFC